MDDEIENEYMRRGYLLPNGCKDLSDLLKLKAEPQNPTPPPPPPITGEIAVPSKMTVRELAAAINKKPFEIVSDLMDFGIFANLNTQVAFEAISKVLRKYGYAAKKTV